MYVAVKFAGPRWSDMDIHNANVATGGRWSDDDFPGGGLPIEVGGPDGGGPDGGLGGAAADLSSIKDLDDLDAVTDAYAQANFIVASVPEHVDELEFANLAEQIIDGPMDLDDLDRQFDRLERATRPLPLGVYPFAEMKQLAKA